MQRERILYPLDTCRPTQFNPQQPASVPLVLFDDPQDWHTTTYNLVLDDLWSPDQLRYEIQQLNEKAVPPHLFQYREILTHQILIIRELEEREKSRELQIKETTLLEERTGINYLIKEHYRTFFRDGEPARNQKEIRIGARFGDLVHGKQEDHEIHNWPCYVVATEHLGGEDLIWVRRGLNRPNRNVVNPDPGCWCKTPDDVLSDEYVVYPAHQLTRLPPIFRQTSEYPVEYTLKTESARIRDNFRNYFPNVGQEQ